MRRAEVVGVGMTLVIALLAAAMQLSAQTATLAERIGQLPAPLQKQLKARQARLQAMTPAQRQALTQRIAAWDALPLAERRRRREHWQAWQALSPSEQWQLRTAVRQFAALPQAQQQALRTQFKKLDGNDRRGWLLGPSLGADYPGLRPLLMQVPVAQREPLLSILRAMPRAERLDLITLAQRTAPQERDALRRELISTPAVNRAGWLRSRLQQ